MRDPSLAFHDGRAIGRHPHLMREIVGREVHSVNADGQGSVAHQGRPVAGPSCPEIPRLGTVSPAARGLMSQSHTRGCAVHPASASTRWGKQRVASRVGRRVRWAWPVTSISSVVVAAPPGAATPSHRPSRGTPAPGSPRTSGSWSAPWMPQLPLEKALNFWFRLWGVLCYKNVQQNGPYVKDSHCKSSRPDARECPHPSE
jgi:hypothetical protein